MALKRILVALFLALWLEFFYKLGATTDVRNLIGSIPIYFLYLSVLAILVRQFKLRDRIITFFVVCGFIGLVAEWFIIGNAPWSNPAAFQLGMFVFHAVYPVIGLIAFSNKEHANLFRKSFITFFVFTVISILGFLIQNSDFRFAWFIWIPLFPYFICSALIIKLNTKGCFGGDRTQDK